MANKSAVPINSSVIFQVYHKLLPLTGLFLVSLIFFARLFFPTSRLFMIPDFGQSDVYHFNLPLKDILHKSLANNRWPLWTENLAAGFPVLAEGQIGTFYLPNLVLFKFLPLVPAYNLNLLLSFFTASSGMYFFCRKIRLGKISSLLSALFFTYSLFFA